VAVDVLLAGLYFLTCFTNDGALEMPLLWTFTLVSLLSEVVLVVWMRTCLSQEQRLAFDVPMNIEYMADRNHGLCMELIGVAIIVPNSFFPGRFPHPGLVVCGDVMVVVLAIVVKLALFDVEQVSIRRHAIRQSQWRAVGYLFVQPLLLFSVCGLGGAASMVIPSAGLDGLAASHPFAQSVMCLAAALAWICLAANMALHERDADTAESHSANAALRLLAALASLAAAAFPVLLGSFGTLAFVVGTSASVVVAQLILNAAAAANQIPQIVGRERDISGLLL